MINQTVVRILNQRATSNRLTSYSSIVIFIKIFADIFITESRVKRRHLNGTDVHANYDVTA